MRPDRFRPETGESTPIPAVKGDVHAGVAGKRFAEREAVLRTAFAAHPERFVRGMPKPPALPQAVWINKPRTQDGSTEALDTKF